MTDRPQNLITGPLIYGMIVPLLMLDACVSFYQWSCFPIYRIAKVRRADYLVFDRRHLEYLNFEHARKILATHARYNRFLAYGDAEDYEARLEEYRLALETAP